MMNDFPCTCGHKEEVHPPNINRRVTSIGRFPFQVCDGCFLENRIKGIKQYGTVDCKFYKPSNLKYFEQLYEAKYK